MGVQTPRPTPASYVSGAPNDKSWEHVPRYRKLLFGQPIRTEHQDHARLPKHLALPVFSSDAISSVAYATQQILLALGVAGLWQMQHQAQYAQLTMGITIAIVALLAIVATSYWQTIFAYPSGGGSYIVSKENLGVPFGLVAGAALLIDYVLTVAVSIAAGVQNLLSTPLMAPVRHQLVPFCLLFIMGLTLANLRGLKESGKLFASPTYIFIAMSLIMVACGLLGPYLGWKVDASKVTHVIPSFIHTGGGSVAGVVLLMLVLKAFANGCSAMTGTEAVSNGVPAFRSPQSRNAAITLIWMALTLGILFLGISALAVKLHVVYYESVRETAMPVIDQLSGAVFGKSGSPLRVFLYYMMQLSTTLVLVLAANTSYADFPRLASLMARDRFLPRQLTNLGDKLVFSNGIVLLGLFSAVLIIGFRGKVDLLIPLYALGVFTAFTLSQSGMVRHWLKERGANWQVKAIINSLGALCTAVVLSVIAIEKGPEGAWIVVVVAAILYVLFLAINRHYERLRRHLSIINYQPEADENSNTVLVLVPSLHRGVFPALSYARSLSADCRAIHIEIAPEETARLRNEWEQYVGENTTLMILPSPFRSIVTPLIAYIREVQLERTSHVVTVVVPEFVPGRWWHGILHNANGLSVKYALGTLPGVVVSNVRYHLDDRNIARSAASVPAEGRLRRTD